MATHLTTTSAPTPPSTGQSMTSVRDASTASLQARLRPEPVADVEAYLLTRLRGILAIGFQAPIGDAAFAARVAEFVGVNQTPSVRLVAP